MKIKSAGKGGWIDASSMQDFVSVLQKKIGGAPLHYLETSKTVPFRMKYLNVRIDMRDGNFLVSSDTPAEQMKFDPTSGGEYPEGYDETSGLSRESINYALSFMNAVDSPYAGDPEFVLKMAESVENFANNKLRYARSNRNTVLSIPEAMAALGMKPIIVTAD